MKKNFIIDYSSYISLKAFGPLLRLLPLWFVLYLGRLIGELLYYFDLKHKSLAYTNIKRAIGQDASGVTKEFYRNFGQSLIEIFLIPKINRAYIDKYISLEGQRHIDEAFKRGKGVVLLGVHAGSWELSNVICANLGFPFRLFVREQGMPRLNKLLNTYRRDKGCKLVQRESQTRELIQALKNNEAIGMTADQGGRKGESVDFFSKSASMSSGAVRIALKYRATILPAYYARIQGPYHKVIIKPPFEIEDTGDKEKDIKENLQRLISIFEKLILEYPADYLWTYKIWKYAKEKNILILNDGKTGHLRQSQAVAKIIKDYLEEQGINVGINDVEVKFRNNIARLALKLSSYLSGKYYCQGCLWCLKKFLIDETYRALIGKKPDIIISCGSSLSPVNFMLSRENLSRSILIMRPTGLSTKRFDLAIIPRHDNPAKDKNILITDGALNLIDADYVKNASQKLIQSSLVGLPLSGLCLGLLLGGDAKKFSLSADVVSNIISQLKSASLKLDADILVTTSRRTSKEIEGIVKKEFQNYPRCKGMILANEKNIPQAMGGILGLSKIVVISPESISMISEAVNSLRHVLVFNAPNLGKKHRRFLEYFAKNNYIYLAEASELGKKIEEIYLKKPPVHTTRDNALVKEAIKKIL
ncbi:MAG: ELM1/GtrOC1 family putative glycosyltransferase [Candidatus Omnitrophica bacterium]|nr:ELM1/GtrOC1 family putative glycosyltransferase [Candidatus Omnitrophota bacterium]